LGRGRHRRAAAPGGAGVIGVVFDVDALGGLGGSKKLAALISLANHGRLRICVPAMALAQLALTASSSALAFHALRLCAEVPDGYMYVASVGENALAVGESMRGWTDDFVLGQTCFEAQALRWSVVTVVANVAVYASVKVETITLDS
jgi:hypothetical protein